MSSKKSKEEVRSELEIILSQVAAYKARGEAPPSALIANAIALASLYPSGDILEKLKRIMDLATEAAQIAAENGKISQSSWLLSQERKDFDAEFARDPNKAFDKYFDDPKVKESMETSKKKRDGEPVSKEANERFIDLAISEEDQYKRAAVASVAALRAEVAKQKGDIPEQEKNDEKLARHAHMEFMKYAFLECKNIRKKLGKPADDHIIKKEDAPLIDKRVDQVIHNIKENIDGGLSALGATMAKVPEVIIDAFKGNMQRVVETVTIAKEEIRVEAQNLIERQAAERKARKEAEEIRKAFQETMAKAAAVEQKDQQKETEQAVGEVAKEEVSQETKVERVSDAKAKMLAKKNKQPKSSEPTSVLSSSELQSALSKHSAVDIQPLPNVHKKENDHAPDR